MLVYIHRVVVCKLRLPEDFEWKTELFLLYSFWIRRVDFIVPIDTVLVKVRTIVCSFPVHSNLFSFSSFIFPGIIFDNFISFSFQYKKIMKKKKKEERFKTVMSREGMLILSVLMTRERCISFHFEKVQGCIQFPYER